MKCLSLLLLLALPVIISPGCKKHAIDLQPPCCEPHFPTLLGYWELHSVQASITPTQTYAAGSGNLLVFAGDRTYTIQANGQVTKTGRFDVVPDTASSSNVCGAKPGPNWARIVYDSNFTADKTFFLLTDTTLQTQRGCTAIDGGVLSMYKRIPKP